LVGKTISAVLLRDELEAAISGAQRAPIPYGQFGSVEELRQAMIDDPMIVGFKEAGSAGDEHLVQVRLTNGEDREIAYRWE
jgi:hypothetical protein